MCLCEYEEGDLLRNLKCGHDFHRDCIDQWLQVSWVRELGVGAGCGGWGVGAGCGGWGEGVGCVRWVG